MNQLGSLDKARHWVKLLVLCLEYLKYVRGSKKINLDRDESTSIFKNDLYKIIFLISAPRICHAITPNLSRHIFMLALELTES